MTARRSILEALFRQTGTLSFRLPVYDGFSGGGTINAALVRSFFNGSVMNLIMSADSAQIYCLQDLAAEDLGGEAEHLLKSLSPAESGKWMINRDAFSQISWSAYATRDFRRRWIFNGSTREAAKTSLGDLMLHFARASPSLASWLSQATFVYFDVDAKKAMCRSNRRHTSAFLSKNPTGVALLIQPGEVTLFVASQARAAFLPGLGECWDRLTSVPLDWESLASDPQERARTIQEEVARALRRYGAPL